MNPLISVIIPTYNHVHFLAKALRSVIDQTYPCWEAVVVDNHSQDNTDELIKDLNEPRIRLLKIHNNGVIAASRNLGIRDAKGEWIGFLDSDDCWYPNKLEAVMSVVKSNHHYDVISNDEYVVDIKTGAKKILRYGPYQEDFYEALLVEGNRLSTSATVVWREFLMQNDLLFSESPKYITVEDYGLWLDLARAGARFEFIREVLGEYVIHGSNSSAQLTRHRENIESLLHHHVFNIQKFNSSPDKLWKQVYPRVGLGQASQYSAQGKKGLSLKIGLEMLVKYPRGTVNFFLSRLLRHSKKSVI